MDYANRYLAQSRGTADEAMAEKRVKFLSSRSPDAEAKPAPAEVAAPNAQPVSVAMPAEVGAGSVQSSETPSDGAAAANPTGKRRAIAIGLLASGGAALAVSIPTLTVGKISMRRANLYRSHRVSSAPLALLCSCRAMEH